MRNKIALSLLIILVYFSPSFATEETITLTTYYPSPYGSYNSLQAKRIGVGDNNNDGTFDSNDIPTTDGDVWIKGKVGIGTNVINQGQALNIKDGSLNIQNSLGEGKITISGSQDGDNYSALYLNNTQYDSPNENAWIISHRGKAGGGSPPVTGSLKISKYDSTSGTIVNAITITPEYKIGVGTDDPQATLEVDGQVKITGGSPGDGKILTSDANGLARWESPSSSPYMVTRFKTSDCCEPTRNCPSGYSFISQWHVGNNCSDSFYYDDAGSRKRGWVVLCVRNN